MTVLENVMGGGDFRESANVSCRELILQSSCPGRRYYPHRLSRDNRIGRIQDDGLIALETIDDLDAVAKVVTGSHSPEDDVTVRLNHRHSQSIRTEQQGSHRQRVGRSGTGHFKMHFGVRSSKQSAGWIVYADLDVQGASGGIDRVGSTDERAREAASGKFRQYEIGFQPGSRNLGVHLGYAHVDP